jgi:predicted lipid-binding transport protein (Tim44 family)
MNKRTPLRATLLAALCTLMLALAPAPADAGPGLGQSLGSRGSRTYSNSYGAAPFQRSITPQQQSGYGYNQPYGGGYGMNRGFGGGGFASGLMGGLIGAGIGGMLFGRGFFGFHGGFGFLGLIIQLALLFFFVRWLMRNVLGQPQFAGLGGLGGGLSGMARNMFPPLQQGPAYGGGGAPRPPSGRPITITQPDYQQFSQLLIGIQAAWSNNDVNGLRAMASPEMVGYFGEQLAELASRGVRNVTRDVRLVHGDLVEAWSEGSREYATVNLRISMIDVTYDSSNRVVDGSATEHVTINEFWTFLRAPGGHWILSAIQQTR